MPVLPIFRTRLGQLFEGDCLAIMPSLAMESVDLIFADPPFNLGKAYSSKINDALEEQNYLDWSYRWLNQAVRLLKPGGSFFLYNLPKVPSVRFCQSGAKEPDTATVPPSSRSGLSGGSKGDD